MIDIKKGRNSFENFPILREKCDQTVILAQRPQQQTTNNIHYNNNTTSVHRPKTTSTTTAAALFPAETSSTTKTRLHTTTTTTTVSVNGKAEANYLHGSGGRRAATVGSTRNTKINTTAKSNNNNSKIHNSHDDTNPVRAANKPFFLVSQFQDQNFLKEECELAHAQVAPKQQQLLQQEEQDYEQVATANGDANNASAHNNNNNAKPTTTQQQQPSGGNYRRKSVSDTSKSNNNTSNSNNHSQKANNAYSIASISRRTATATTTPTAATVAAVTSNGVRRSGGGSANASVNINNQHHHHHHHVNTTASAVATTSTNASANVTAKSATNDTTVHKVDIVFNNRAPTQANGGRFVTSKSAKQPHPHSTYNATRPLNGTTILATTNGGAPATSNAATSGVGTSAVTATKLSNGQGKLVRPLVHRTIPSTAVAAANAAAARENVNAYSNKLFNSYSSNSNRLSNNNNNNINNNGVNSVCISNNSGGGSSNNNITSGVNGMQHTLEHDDIKYIDSDDAPTTAALAHASATTVTTPARGGAQLERKTQLRCEQQLCCQHTNCATSTTATLTGASAAAGVGGASLKTRMRPKSTIICSTSNLVFEKINNYKYANGSAGGGSSAAKFAAEAAAARRNELRHSIDSNSIRASIEKFDSFSEQKRSAGLPQVTLRSHGGGGGGSTNNLQHHRHSGSEFDHATSGGSSSLLRLAQSGGGGGSLTRAPYRTVSPSPATACKVTATMHAPSLTPGSAGTSPSSSSSIRSGACNTNSLPTKSLGSALAATSNATTAITAINRHQELSVLRAAERASPNALLHKDTASMPASATSSPLLKQADVKLPNGDVKKCAATAVTNGACDGAGADVETMNIRRPCCCH